MTTPPTTLHAALPADSFGGRLASGATPRDSLVALMLDNSPDALVLLDGDGRFQSMNKPGLSLLEIDDAAALQGKAWAPLWPAEAAAEAAAAVASAARGETARFCAFGPSAKGAPKWWDVLVSPLRGADGAPPQILCALRDITELKQSEKALKDALEAKESLLYEVNHRVKNSLALVTSLLSLQAGHAKEPVLKRALDEARSRVGVVAQVHQRLYQSNRHSDIELGPFIADIGRDVVGVFDPEDRVTVEAACEDGIILGLDKAVPLALLTSELITNALKYAFATNGGTLRIELRKRDGNIHLRVCDDGPGLPDGFKIAGGGGLGMRIVGALTRQIRAQISASNAPGACFDLVFPAEPEKDNNGASSAHTGRAHKDGVRP